MENRNIILIAACLVELLPGCRERRAVREVATITEVRVRNNNSEVKVKKVITDPQAIANIVDFVNSERQGWGGLDILFGTPSPRLMVELYDHNQIVRTFGVGKEFFWTNTTSPRQPGEGPSTAKGASKARVQQFLDLVGVDAEVIDLR